MTLLLHSAPFANAAEKYAELDPQRIVAVAAMLAPHASGFGRPAADRAAWKAVAEHHVLGSVVRQAERILAEKFPVWNDDDYLDFSRSGKRPRGEDMLRARSGRLYPLVMAECLEGRGRFLPAIAAALHEYAAQPTWTLPAHDRDLKCFHRKAYSVDLGSSMFAVELGQTLYLLGDKLPASARKETLAALETRVFAPVRRSLQTNKGHFWLRGTNNWNAVCWGGVVGAALAALDDRHDRAVFLAAGEHYSRYYLSGFSSDGYCVEGIGYWDYGFSYFILLREELLRASGGRIDLFTDPKIRNIALFGPRIEICDGVCPAFGDCHFGARPSAAIIAYCDHTLGLGLKTPELVIPVGGITGASIKAFPSPVVKPPGEGEEPAIGLRSWFPDAGILVCRPAPGSKSRLGICIKAGGNGSHSHNDAGSFAIAIDGEQPLGDPGGPHAYQSDTFGPKRYEHKLFNSFGHPVPVVAGQLQVDATKVQPKVISHRFSDEKDELEIDLGRSYAVPELRTLVRKIVYDRTGWGSIVLEDCFAFSRPAAFEVGLPTHGTWRQIDSRTIEFRKGSARLLAEIDTPDGFDVQAETIEDNCPPFPRLGIRLKEPLASGTVKVTLHP